MKIQMKSNDHLTFQYIIDYWDARLYEGMPGTILSCNVVATRGFSSHSCATGSICRYGRPPLFQNFLAVPLFSCFFVL